MATWDLSKEKLGLDKSTHFRTSDLTHLRQYFRRHLRRIFREIVMDLKDWVSVGRRTVSQLLASKVLKVKVGNCREGEVFTDESSEVCESVDRLLRSIR